MRENEQSRISELERQISQIASTIEQLSTGSSQTQNIQQETTKSFSELVQALKEAQPSWEKDGGGVIGTQASNSPLAASNAVNNNLPEIPKFDFKQTVPETAKLEEDPPVTQEVVQSGGVGQNCVGLNIYTKTNEDGDQEVWIGAGTVAGQVPDDFDSIEGKLIENSGSGLVWAKIEIDENLGTIVSVNVDNGEEIPDNSNTSFHYPLGAYEQIESDNEGNIRFTVENYDCGSVDVNICRNWFRSTAPFYGVSFSR
jgi:uncharacterized coiled-coil protein SlyX